MQTKEFREPTHTQIAEQAYLKWKAEGRLQGVDKADWFAAETDLLKRQAGMDGVVWARETKDLLR